MLTTEIGKQRLLQLAEHLKHGKLAHDRFDFGTIHSVENCGSAGCALGELPTLWPESFFIRPNVGDVRLMPGGQTIPEFFGITGRDFIDLFFPGHILSWCNNTLLPRSASKDLVADSIIAFVNWEE